MTTLIWLIGAAFTYGMTEPAAKSIGVWGRSRIMIVCLCGWPFVLGAIAGGVIDKWELTNKKRLK